MSIPFFDLAAAHEALATELSAAFQATLQRSQFIMGPELTAFEAEFALACGAAHTIGTGNGLDALRLALQALRIGPGDDVIVPAHTFVATWLAVVEVGARPIGVDVDPTTFLLDADKCAAAITSKTRAIIPVHLYGRLANIGTLVGAAKSRSIAIVEDAAQAHGARDGSAIAGSIGDAAAFSFYPTKNLGALGDGGAVTTDDPQLAERVRMLGNYGSRRKYEHELAGLNSRLDELQAAVLRAKLPHLAKANMRRRQLAGAYRERLMDIAALTLPPGDEAGRESVWHLFVVRTDKREALRRHLADREITTLVHYPIAPHLQPGLRELGYAKDDFPIAERIADTALSLPLWPEMTLDQVDRVCDEIRAWSKEQRHVA